MLEQLADPPALRWTKLSREIVNLTLYSVSSRILRPGKVFFVFLSPAPFSFLIKCEKTETWLNIHRYDHWTDKQSMKTTNLLIFIEVHRLNCNYEPINVKIVLKSIRASIAPLFRRARTSKVGGEVSSGIDESCFMSFRVPIKTKQCRLQTCWLPAWFIYLQTL